MMSMLRWKNASLILKAKVVFFGKFLGDGLYLYKGRTYRKY